MSGNAHQDQRVTHEQPKGSVETAVAGYLAAVPVLASHLATVVGMFSAPP